VAAWARVGRPWQFVYGGLQMACSQTDCAGCAVTLFALRQSAKASIVGSCCGPEKGITVAAFLRRATAWYAERGIKVRRVMTDNGSGYVSKVFAGACPPGLARRRRGHSIKRSPTNPSVPAGGPPGFRVCQNGNAPFAKTERWHSLRTIQ
jgi:hypothetical protein